MKKPKMELHTHDSIPTYVCSIELENSCSICIRNKVILDYDAYILPRLEVMRFPKFVVKTSEQLNKRIDKLIKEIRGEG